MYGGTHDNPCWWADRHDKDPIASSDYRDRVAVKISANRADLLGAR